jgi:hypothetical protein
MSQLHSGGEPRRNMPVGVYRLGHEPGDDLSAVTTVGERLAMVAELSRRMELLLRRDPPSYTRSTMPVTVRRPA